MNVSTPGWAGASESVANQPLPYGIKLYFFEVKFCRKVYFLHF